MTTEIISDLPSRIPVQISTEINCIKIFIGNIGIMVNLYIKYISHIFCETNIRSI